MTIYGFCGAGLLKGKVHSLGKSFLIATFSQLFVLSLFNHRKKQEPVLGESINPFMRLEIDQLTKAANNLPLDDAATKRLIFFACAMNNLDGHSNDLGWTDMTWEAIENGLDLERIPTIGKEYLNVFKFELSENSNQLFWELSKEYRNAFRKVIPTLPEESTEFPYFNIDISPLSKEDLFTNALRNINDKKALTLACFAKEIELPQWFESPTFIPSDFERFLPLDSINNMSYNSALKFKYLFLSIDHSIFPKLSFGYQQAFNKLFEHHELGKAFIPFSRRLLNEIKGQNPEAKSNSIQALLDTNLRWLLSSIEDVRLRSEYLNLFLSSETQISPFSIDAEIDLRYLETPSQTKNNESYELWKAILKYGFKTLQEEHINLINQADKITFFWDIVSKSPILFYTFDQTVQLAIKETWTKGVPPNEQPVLPSINDLLTEHNSVNFTESDVEDYEDYCYYFKNQKNDADFNAFQPKLKAARQFFKNDESEWNKLEPKTQEAFNDLLEKARLEGLTINVSSYPSSDEDD